MWLILLYHVRLQSYFIRINYKIQSLMAYHHSSVFNNFVTKIHLCCGAWSILQVVGRSAEAHLIVLMLEALNLCSKY